jgi:hypothetical protein
MALVMTAGFPKMPKGIGIKELQRSPYAHHSRRGPDRQKSTIPSSYVFSKALNLAVLSHEQRSQDEYDGNVHDLSRDSKHEVNEELHRNNNHLTYYSCTDFAFFMLGLTELLDRITSSISKPQAGRPICI